MGGLSGASGAVLTVEERVVSEQVSARPRSGDVVFVNRILFCLGKFTSRHNVTLYASFFNFEAA